MEEITLLCECCERSVVVDALDYTEAKRTDRGGTVDVVLFANNWSCAPDADGAPGLVDVECPKCRKACGATVTEVR